MLLSTGARRIELMRGTLPPEAGIRSLTAQLTNPFAAGQTSFSLASAAVSLPVGP
jgi:hypothetical protein